MALKYRNCDSCAPTKHTECMKRPEPPQCATYVGLAWALHERPRVVGCADRMGVVDEVDERDWSLEKGRDPLSHLTCEAMYLFM